MIEGFLMVLATIIFVILAFLLQSLIIWGVIAFFIHVFSLAFPFTFLHAIAVSLAYTLIKAMFRE